MSDDAGPRRFRRVTDVDGKFRDVDETRPEPRLEVVPEPAEWRPVSALGGEMTDASLAPGELRHYRNETNDRLARIEGSVADIKADLASIKTLLSDLVTKPRKARGKK